MKKISRVIGGLIVIALILMGSIFVWWTQSTKSVSTEEESVRVVIPKGRSAEAIGKDLEEQGLIRSALAFKMYVQLTNKQDSINAGEFELRESMSLAEIVEALGEGPVELWVTIPEGLRREEVAERIASGISLQGKAQDAFIESFLELTQDSEGYLFPDTYLVPRDVTPFQVISLMKNTFDTKFTDALRTQMNQAGLTLEETVSLASILEKETKTDAERPVIAGIYFNRLDIGQPLQTDASVQYVLGTRRCEGVLKGCDWWEPPLRGDLTIDSVYNTYTNAGIPPEPISNPGLSSLSSVVQSTDNPYFYYIHEPDGTVHYAVTLSEHNANVQKYLR